MVAIPEFRYHLWIEQFCSKFTKQDLLDFQKILFAVFTEEDPKYDLPMEQRCCLPPAIQPSMVDSFRL
jgi:hypothetical protein